MVKVCCRVFIILLFCIPLVLQAQECKKDSITILFYNVENYFDTINNPHTIDEFTPDDIYEWTSERYITKRNNIAEVILAAHSNSFPPDLIGLCEVENRQVLDDLINNTPLKSYGYSILHNNSPDARGIDVALLYKKERFVINDSAFFLMGHAELNKTKREILYAKGIVNGQDTLHVFVTHFPSKRDGVTKTHPLRQSAAQQLRYVTDSILLETPNANIVIMGDFNDTYKSKIFTDDLCTHNFYNNPVSCNLYNLSAQLAQLGEGSIKYRNRWQLVDMFIVSGNLLNRSSAMFCNPDNVKIIKHDFLLEYMPAKNTYRPKPTYRWINYIGGYSDHLPVSLTLYVN